MVLVFSVQQPLPELSSAEPRIFLHVSLSFSKSSFISSADSSLNGFIFTKILTEPLTISSNVKSISIAPKLCFNDFLTSDHNFFVFSRSRYL